MGIDYEVIFAGDIDKLLMDLNKKNMNTEFTIPKDIEKDAVKYMENVLQNLKDNGVLENVDSAALTMLARNYSMFIKASK
jgi:phage terminase small subunit